MSPALSKFLLNLMRTKKWTRKITLPSTHDDVAVALVFTSTLKETGLEILSELHVFFSGEIIIEEWQVVGESEKTSTLPKELFSSVSIGKVHVEGEKVHVALTIPMSDGISKNIVKIFDFGLDEPRMRAVPHPLLEKD